MYHLNKLSMAFLAVLLCLNQNIPALAQTIQYRLEPGSQYVPVDSSPQVLWGAFTWELAGFEGDYIRLATTALHFETSQFRFDLSPVTSDSGQVLVLPNGLSAPVYSFSDAVNLYDHLGNLIQSDLYFTGIGEQLGHDPVRFEFGELELRTGEIAREAEVLGHFRFSAVAVPELSSSWFLLAGGISVVFAYFLRQRVD